MVANNFITNIKTGIISYNQVAIIDYAVNLFVKSKSSSTDEGLIEYIDYDNDNVIGSISLEVGERKTYNAPRGRYLPRIRITAGSNSTIEYEYI